jgi:predicted metalloendopeptidase
MQIKIPVLRQWRKYAFAILCIAASGSLALPVAEAVAQAASVTGQSLQPGDDFFTYVNSDWLAKTEIPADRSAWGAGAALAEDTNARLRQLVEDAAGDKSAKGERRKIGDFYASIMDEAGIEAKGIKPLAPMLNDIKAIRNKSDLARVLGSSIRADVDALNATNFFTENLFGLWIVQGLNDPQRYTPYLLQGGLGMPDRAYYLSDNPRMVELRTKYLEHIAAILRLAGLSRPEARASRIFELEMKIAQSHASREDSADVQKANNTWRSADFTSKAPGMDWKIFFKAAHLEKENTFIVWHPGAVTGASKLVANADVQTWRDFLRFHLVNHYSYALPKAFGDEHFAFYERSLSGTPEMSPRWKRGLAATNLALVGPVGHLYVDKYFPAENKARLNEMVVNIVAAFSKRIDKVDWMAPATREQAQAKLKTLYVGIGYPDKWQSYEGLKIKAGDALGNARRAETFRLMQQLAKLGKPVDRTEWSMPPQLVNAVNMPMQNAINFPAAILQPPFYDPNGSDAVNYGAIGSVIGHEISHSFDDQGAQFDAQGRLRNWWTPEDLAHFKQAADLLAAQFSTYKPFPDLSVNGRQTLSENLADLAGLNASFDAFKSSREGKPASADEDRQYFIGFAQSRRTKARDAALRRQIVTDGHAPSQYRAATVRNLDAWYRAFDVQPGQALYLAPADRVRVW